ncbi:MAG: hypothetical protein ACRD4Q_04310 [Candidatus Acidiferrales bacterium]
MTELTQTLFSRVERLWAEHQATGRQRLCNLDYATLDLWVEGGIAPWAILIGVERALCRFRPRHSRDRVRSILYCEQEVLSEFDSNVEQRVADYWARREEPCPEDITDLK